MLKVVEMIWIEEFWYFIRFLERAGLAVDHFGFSTVCNIDSKTFLKTL